MIVWFTVFKHGENGCQTCAFLLRTMSDKWLIKTIRFVNILTWFQLMQ